MFHQLHSQQGTNADVRCSVSLTVCTPMNDDDFSLSLATFKYLFLDLHNLVLWVPAFALAVLLRIITSKYHHQLIFPICASPPALSFPCTRPNRWPMLASCHRFPRDPCHLLYHRRCRTY